MNLEELIYVQGINEVPRNQRMRFISQQRNETSTDIRDGLSSLAKAFPLEFGNIAQIQDTDELEEAFEELVENFEGVEVKFPLAVYEFLFCTYSTEPDANADFGLPSFPLQTLDEKALKGWTAIELDFDEEVDVFAHDLTFVVCIDIKSPRFGNVCLWDKRILYRVSDDFVAFFQKFVEMMTTEFAGCDGEKDQQQVLEGFYYQFTDE